MDVNECMICMENPGEDKLVRLCERKHPVCHECFQEWVKQEIDESHSVFSHIHCPSCRGPLMSGKEYSERIEDIFWSRFTGSVFYEHPLHLKEPTSYPKEIEVSFLDGKRDGIYREFGPSGIILREDHYSNGHLHGLSFVFNQGYSRESEYVHGVRNGPFRHLHPSGMVLWEGTNVDGKLHGVCISREPNGNFMEVPYCHGVYHGHWLYWKKNAENGEMYLYKDVLYEQGERHGPTKVFHPNGELVSELEYVHGKIPLLQEDGTTMLITREKYIEIYLERREWI